jgi:hypothetical protein
MDRILDSGSDDGGSNPFEDTFKVKKGAKNSLKRCF